MPSEMACLIEQRFAESQLTGTNRRLGDIVDEVLEETTAKLMGHSLDELKQIANIDQGVQGGLRRLLGPNLNKEII